MKLSKFLTTIGVTTTLVTAQIIGLPNSNPKVAQAQTDPVAIRQCVNGLVYTSIYNDGRPNGSSKTGMPTDLATAACRGINSSSEAQQMRRCVNGLVYTSIYNDGRPNGSSKTGTSFLEAVDACSSNANSNQQPYYPPQRTEQGGDPQAIADCIKKLMYERRPVCTRSSCARLGSPADNANRGFGGWQWQTVRTDISEGNAARACRNARY